MNNDKYDDGGAIGAVSRLRESRRGSVAFVALRSGGVGGNGAAVAPEGRPMTQSRGRRLWLAAFILLCCAGTIYRTSEIRHWGDALSTGVDPFSEANALR